MDTAFEPATRTATTQEPFNATLQVPTLYIAAHGHSPSSDYRMSSEVSMSTPLSAALEEVTRGDGRSSQAFTRSNKIYSQVQLQNRRKEDDLLARQLEQKRVDYGQRMQAIQLGREQLLSQRTLFQERRVKFDRFINENELKRQRSLNSAQSETRLRLTKEAEIRTLQETLRQQQDHCQEQRDRIQKYACYEAYLLAVLRVLPAGFTDSPEPHLLDIIRRFETLKEVNQDLRHRLARTSQRVDELQTQWLALTDGHAEQSVLLNATLNSKQKQLAKMKVENSQLEQQAEETQQQSAIKRANMSQATLALDNLYARLILTASEWSRRTKGTSRGTHTTATLPVQAATLWKKLDSIQDRMHDYAAIVALASQRWSQNRRNTNSTATAAGHAPIGQQPSGGTVTIHSRSAVSSKSSPDSNKPTTVPTSAATHDDFASETQSETM